MERDRKQISREMKSEFIGGAFVIWCSFFQPTHGRMIAEFCTALPFVGLGIFDAYCLRKKEKKNF